MNVPDDLEFVLSGSADVPGFRDAVARLYRRAAGLGLVQAVDVLTARDLVGLVGGAAPGAGEDPCLHALLICLFGALNEKKICLRVDGASLPRLLHLFAEEGGPVDAEAVRAALEAGRWPGLVGGEGDGYRPLVHVRDRDARYLYFQRYFQMEKRVKEALEARFRHGDQAPGAAPEADALRSCIRQVLEGLPVRMGREPQRLNDPQKAALCLCLLKDFVLVSGGPGTGKTSIVVTLLRCLARDPLRVPLERIRLAAPTGRAANRMLESVRTQLASIEGYPGLPADHPDKRLRHVRAETLHRMLRYSPSRGAFVHHAGNPLPVDAVVVDEVSMVDVSLMAALLQAIPAGARIIFLGDRHQLPSVEVGAVLPDLVPAVAAQGISAATAAAVARMVSMERPLDTAPAASRLTDRVVLLEHSYRNDEAVRRLAEAVNGGRAEEALALLRPLEVRFARVPGPGGGGQEAGPAAGHEAVIGWPSRARPGPAAPGGRAGAPGPGVFWIDAAPLRQAEVDRVVQGWARHQYLSGEEGEGGLADLVREAARGLDLDDPGGAPARDLLRRIFARVEASRILSPLRRGPAGTDGVNGCVGRFLCERFDPGRRDGLFAGMPVMVTRNDHVRQLYNGDIGIILRGRQGFYRAVFPRLQEASMGYAAHAIDALPPFEPAFAVTVHKSQGAEYDQVLLLLPPADAQARRHRMLTREILYTGITRTRHAVVVCSSEDVLRGAIETGIEHESGIRFW